MKTCLSCNITFPDEKLFCKHCGQPLAEPGQSASRVAEEQERSAPLGTHCPVCGQLLKTDAKFCPACGATIAPEAECDREPTVAAATVVAEQARPQRKDQGLFNLFQTRVAWRQSQRTMLLFAALVLVLAGIPIALFLTDFNRRSEVDSLTEQSAAQPEAQASVLVPPAPEQARKVEQQDSRNLSQPAAISAAPPAVAPTPRSQPAEAAQAPAVHTQAISAPLPPPQPSPEAVQAKSNAIAPEPAPAPATPPAIPVAAGEPVQPPPQDVSRPSLFRGGEAAPTDAADTTKRISAADYAIRGEIFEAKTLSLLSASGNRKGDKFRVQILQPERFRNAFIEGEVTSSKASGKVSGKSELNFSFDTLTLPDGTAIPIQADLQSVKNSQGKLDIDEEGHAIARSSKKKDVARTALLSGLGALVGGLAGGKEGAVKGAAIGAAVGLTVVFSTRGEDIKFAPGSVFVLAVNTKSER